MRIRKYADFPAAFVPDEGEVVLAARSPAGPFLRAAVTKVRRASRGKFRVNFVWLESNEGAFLDKPAVTGEKGHVYIATDDRVPLIRRVPAGRGPRPAPAQGTGPGQDVTSA